MPIAKRVNILPSATSSIHMSGCYSSYNTISIPTPGASVSISMSEYSVTFDPVWNLLQHKFCSSVTYHLYHTSLLPAAIKPHPYHTHSSSHACYDARSVQRSRWAWQGYIRSHRYQKHILRTIDPDLSNPKPSLPLAHHPPLAGSPTLKKFL